MPRIVARAEDCKLLDLKSSGVEIVIFSFHSVCLLRWELRHKRRPRACPGFVEQDPSSHQLPKRVQSVARRSTPAFGNVGCAAY